MTRTRFCAECGKTSVALHENFCEPCYWRFHQLASIKQSRIDLPYCLECGSIKMKSGWTGPNYKEEIPEIIAYAHFNTIITDPSSIISIQDISELNWLNPNPEFFVNFAVESDMIVEFGTHQELLQIEVKIHGGTCTTCIKKKTGTGDVTVQFRAKNRKITKEEMDAATTMAFTHARDMTYESQDAYLSDIIENYGGLDFYFGNDAVAETFVQSLKKKWIGHYEKNFKLVTEDREERRVYAITHLFRLPEVQIDDLTIHEGELYQVRHISKAGVHLLWLRDHSRLLTKEWKGLKPLDPPPFFVRKLVVSENIDGNSYLLMDLTNYDNREYSRDNFPFPLKMSVEYDFLEWKESLYLNPTYTIGDQE